MKLSILINLTLNVFFAFSQSPHDWTYLVGCFDNGTVRVQWDFDFEEVLHVDFVRHEIVFTCPSFFTCNISEIFSSEHIYRNAEKAKIMGLAVVTFLKGEEGNPPQATEPPETMLYSSEELQLGVENSLICFLDSFYPPITEISWTKNGHLLLEGVSHSQYYLNSDQTFRQLSTLTFTPEEGDIYTCTVEHGALDVPDTKTFEVDTSHPSIGADVFCGVSLTVGSLGFATGIFLAAKKHTRI
ncbi:RLA class II histocompatibility antigen, DP alpha-1 chain-like [Aulostomus maculatus]